MKEKEIRRAVFSFFNPKRNACGYESLEDCLISQCLAIEIASRHFDEVELYTDNWGYALMEGIEGLPINFKVNNRLEEISKVNPYFWAYAKIHTYSIQDKPFLHIDNDVYMWNGLKKEHKESRLLFQSKELFKKPGYGYYDLLKPIYNKAPKKVSELVEVKDFAYNCGVCGGWDLEFFKKWREWSEGYIFAPENQRLFFVEHTDMLIHQNLFHEQYFCSSLIKKKGLRNQVNVLGEEIHDISKNGYKYTHLWGTTKKEAIYTLKFKQRLYDENALLYSSIISKKVNEWNQ
jgi:hypothetical protein